MNKKTIGNEPIYDARTLGAPYDLCSPGFAIKLYPSCSSTHRAIDALTELIRENELKPADIAKVEEILMRLSQLVTDYPQVVELDINPLMISDKTGEAIAVDGRIKIKL